MEVYEKLRAKLDCFPLGCPDQEEMREILRLLFDEDEARLAASTPNPPLTYTAAKIADRAGVDRRTAAQRLARMADKGLIAEIDVLAAKRYMLIPAYPGFIEMQFMQGQEQTENRRRAGALWHSAYSGPFGKEAHGYPTKSMRVVPVRKSISTGQKVFSYEEAEKIVRDSGIIGVTDCACRKAVHNCDRPLDVCMLFGPAAKYSIDRNLATRITAKQAVKTLQKADDAGLVHMASNSKPPVTIICNCCTCCCSSLKGLTVLHNPVSTMACNFVSGVVNASSCKLCEMCVKVCPMHALTIEDDQIVVDQEKCLGCGLCVHKCKTHTLALKRRSNKTPEPSGLRLMAKMLQERDKLPRIFENIPRDLL
jgi:Fe-S-cluster-containing hydrogenase component 2